MALRVFPVDPSGRPEFADAFGAHRGTDIFAPAGTPVVAVDFGNARATDDPKGGMVLYLTSTDGTVYYYAHLTEYVGSYPRKVQAGEAVATVGTSGNAQGKAPHLHFEIHPHGTKDAIDPYLELVSVAPRGAEKLPVPLAPLPSNPLAVPTSNPVAKKKTVRARLGCSSWWDSRRLQPTSWHVNVPGRCDP
jgi:murein DD-endopeptidase MepM/ murein hydrolase activator NlpD